MAVDSNATVRDPSFTVLKGLAILFVVTAHASGPAWLSNLAYIFCVPVFFMCSGYFFSERRLDAPKTYLWHRFRNLYCPFWAWSVIFLVLHNLFFKVGLLSEQYGNAAGGVLHPYSWHETVQHLWSITFNLSGYDPFLCGQFWFFRTLIVSSVAFYFLYLAVRRFTRWQRPEEVAAVVLALSLGLALWMVTGQLRITGLAQGGYRELMAVAFMSLGLLYRCYARLFRPGWLAGLLGVAVLCLFAWKSPSAMVPSATFVQFVSLPLPAFAAFVALHALSRGLAAKKGLWLTRGLTYIGERTLYVYAFHFLAFKAVSLVKVIVCDLPWSRLGGHPVVHEGAHEDYFFLLYIVAGVALPLGVVALWKRLDVSYNLTWYNCLRYLCRALLWLAVLLWKGLRWLCRLVSRAVTATLRELKDLAKASSPKEE